jgi:hypothetical protein
MDGSLHTLGPHGLAASFSVAQRGPRQNIFAYHELPQQATAFAFRVSYSMRTSCNSIALCCCEAEIMEMFWWFRASRASAHCAHDLSKATTLA